jgi:hypothetical protein
MRKYKAAQKLPDEQFRRQTGVKKATYERMLKLLTEAEKEKRKQGGKPNNLTLGDRLLMCLEYLREYRTYFHIAQSYGVSESTCYRNCVWVENILVKAKEFTLPSRKAYIDDHTIEVIVVDATETPIQRPQKNNESTTQVRRNVIHSKHK